MSAGAGTEGHVVVRRAVQDDIARIVELFEYGSLVEGNETPGDLVPYRAALDELENSPGVVLVAAVPAGVVGVLQLIVFRHLQAQGGLCAEVESVHVHPDRRGAGIGRALMTAAIEEARRLGCYRVQLTSNNTRIRAHHFYEELGFQPSHLGFKLFL